MFPLRAAQKLVAPTFLGKTTHTITRRAFMFPSKGFPTPKLAAVGIGMGFGVGLSAGAVLLTMNKGSFVSSSVALRDQVAQQLTVCSNTDPCQVQTCADEEEEEFSLAQKCAAEAIGTGIIVGGGCGAVCSLKYAGGTPIKSVALAFGASVALVR